MRPDNVRYLITHARLIDGHGELKASRLYQPFETFCGICDAPFVVHPRIQKYILEIRRVPVKIMRDGGVFCVPCRRRRSRIRWLRAHDHWRAVPNGLAEIGDLEAHESRLKLSSRKRYRDAIWPYPLD